MKIGFIVECSQDGPEDKIVRSVVSTFCPKDEVVVSAMIDKGKLLAGAVVETQKLFDSGCERVFVIWDWHPIESKWSDKVKARWRPGECRIEAHDLRGQLKPADLQANRVVLICVTQELEAWALADHRAISAVIAARRRRPEEPVRKTSKPEQCPNPEDVLDSIFRDFDVELAKYTDVPAILKQAQATRFHRLKSCPGFVRLVEKLTGKSFDQAVEVGDE